MKAFLINFQFKENSTNYRSVNAEIRRLGAGCQCLDYTWIIKSNFSSAQIAIHLKPLVHAGDKFIIVAVSTEAAWLGLDDICSLWLKDSL